MLYLHGIGHFHPENVIDNDFLESLDIGTNCQWIMERVGIERRRTVLPLDYIKETRNSDPRMAREASQYSDAYMAAEACQMALKRANLTKADIGLVISGSCSAQWSLPAEACRVANELEIEAPCFDLNSGCATFGTILHFLSAMQPQATAPYILVLNPEASTRVIDYNNRNTAVLFGDGASAAIVSLQVAAPTVVDTTTMHSDPSGWKAATIVAGGYFDQVGKTVQAFAIRRTVSTLKKLRFDTSSDPKNMYFIGHQANRLMLEGVCRHSEVAADRHLYNVDEFGNCASSGAPAVLSQHWDHFQDGDHIAMVVVGSGLSWSSLHIKRTNGPSSD